MNPKSAAYRNGEKRFPWMALAYSGLAITVWILPGIAPMLVFDRIAILRGEIWRLFTGHFVHFSVSHFGLDLFAFAIAGIFFEMETHGSRLGMMVGLPLALGVMLLWTQPDLAYYGGLSGLTAALVIYLALVFCTENRARRFAGLLTLMILTAKFLVECGDRKPLFAAFFPEEAAVCPAAHAIGGMLAAGLFGYGILARRSKIVLRAVRFHSRSLALWQEAGDHSGTPKNLEAPSSILQSWQ